MTRRYSYCGACLRTASTRHFMSLPIPGFLILLRLKAIFMNGKLPQLSFGFESSQRFSHDARHVFSQQSPRIILWKLLPSVSLDDPKACQCHPEKDTQQDNQAANGSGLTLWWDRPVHDADGRQLFDFLQLGYLVLLGQKVIDSFLRLGLPVEVQVTIIESRQRSQ